MRIQNNKPCLFFLHQNLGKVVVSEGTCWGANRKEVGPLPSWVWTFLSVQVLFSVFPLPIARDSAMAASLSLISFFWVKQFQFYRLVKDPRSGNMQPLGHCGIISDRLKAESLKYWNSDRITCVKSAVEKTSLGTDKHWYFSGQ